jgi:hypothetical protein
MNEEFTICGKCGKQIPQSQFCIYCGYNLLKNRGKIQQSWEEPEEPQSFEPPKLVSSPALEEHIFTEPLAVSTMPPYPATPAVDSSGEALVMQAWSELLKYQIWRVKLCTIFKEQEIPERVFSNIWEGYGKEVSRLQRTIEEIKGTHRASYMEKKAELDDAELKLDELRVRVAIGELTESDLLIRTPGIRGNVDNLRSEVTRLEERMREKEAKRPGESPKEMFEHEQSAKAFVVSIDGLITEGKLSEELGTKLGTEMDEIREFFSSMVGDPIERDLMNELETLDVRYKVGEITLAEMESLKGDIVAKLERQWTN